MNNNYNMNYGRRKQNAPHRSPNKKSRFPFGMLFISMLAITAVFAVIWAAALENSIPSAKPSGTAGTVQSSEDGTLPTDSGNVVDPNGYTEMTLLSTGDLMYHSPQIEAAYNSADGTYDFSPTFKYIREVVADADYSVINFETTLAGSEYEYSGWPTFNSPDEGFEAVIDAGFDMMLFANNHCYDKKLPGVLRTIKMFENAGVDYVGAKANTSDKSYKNVTVNGITLGILNSTDDLSYGATGTRTVNGITLDSGDLDHLDVFNLSLLDQFYAETAKRIKSLRDGGADLIVYYIHWGNEYSLEHNETQAAMAKKLCDLGVDVIIGGHPHVVQDAEIITSSTDPSHKTLCFYSLGNFVSNQNRLTLGDTANKEYTENGLMVKLTVRKYNSGECLVTNVETIPLWVHRYRDTAKMNYIVVPLESALADPSAFGLYDSSFGITNAKSALQMTNATLGGICEAFAGAVSLPVK